MSIERTFFCNAITNGIYASRFFRHATIIFIDAVIEVRVGQIYWRSTQGRN